ncbi:MAG: DNA internalization-related competence protein ComEC/Rec2 [Desulfobacteraceae bacterium]
MNQMVKRPFISIFIFFGLGIFSGEKTAFPFEHIFISVLILFSALIILCLKNKKSLIIPLVFFYFLGILFITPVSKTFYNSKAEKFNLYSGEKRKIIALATGFPKLSGSKLKTEVKLLSIDEKNLESENLKFSLSIYNNQKNYEPGDILGFTARIKPFRNFKNPGSFDYESYMRFNGLYGHMWASGSKIDFCGKKKSFDFFIERVRKDFADVIDKNISEKDNAEFLKAVTCGIRTGLGQKFKDMASYAGASHFMAISGLHIGMVFSFFFILSRFVFSRISFFLWQGWVKKASVITGISGALFYALLSGLMPSAQRALVLALLGGTGFFLNRNHDPLNLLFCCGFFILALTPQYLFSIGFILSFLAVLSIITGFMAFPENFKKNSSLFNKFIKWIKIVFKTSVFAVAGTSPAALYFFNILPLTGVFTGIILIPLFSFVLLPSAFAGLLSFYIFPELSKFFFSVSSFSADIFVELISVISGLKFTYINIGISGFELFLTYFFLIVIFRGAYIFVLRIKPDFMFKAFACVVLILIMSDVFVETEKRFFNEHGKIVFFDIGKGNSTLIVFPGGKTVLVDSGGFPGSDFDTGRYIIAPYLLKNKIKTIDVCISTHGDYDHYSGFFYIMERFKINKFVFNNTLENSGGYKKLISNAEKKGIVLKPQKIDMGKGSIDFLQQKELFDNENDNSLLTSVKINNVKILFTGDLYIKGQDCYKDEEFIKNSDIFMVPHHGSVHSLNRDFIKAASPGLAVISGSFRNYEKTQKKVEKIYEDLGIKVYNINDKGAFVADTEKIKGFVQRF